MEKKPTRLHGVYKSDGCESGCSRNLTRKTRKEAEVSSAGVLHPVSRPRPPSRVFLRTGSGSRGRTEGPCVPQPDLFSSLATAQNTKPERWELGSVCVCVCPRRSRDTDPATLGPACLGLGRRRAPGSGGATHSPWGRVSKWALPKSLGSRVCHTRARAASRCSWASTRSPCAPRPRLVPHKQDVTPLGSGARSQGPDPLWPKNPPSGRSSVRDVRSRETGPSSSSRPRRGGVRAVVTAEARERLP